MTMVFFPNLFSNELFVTKLKLIFFFVRYAELNLNIKEKSTGWFLGHTERPTLVLMLKPTIFQMKNTIY